MLRRTIFSLAALALLAGAGCQSRLAKSGSYSELRAHALRLDHEFNRLHIDVKEIFFGLEEPPAPPVWEVYED